MAYYEDNTFNDLRNRVLPSSTSWEGVSFAKGRTAAGDQGAGIFSWHPGLTSPVDNGGTVLSSSSSGVDGRWMRHQDVRGPVHAEWFGAKGNDTGDDSAAIQECLNQFGRVDLLAKTYRIEASLKLTTKDGFGYRIQGAGVDKTIIKDGRLGKESGPAVLTVIENMPNVAEPVGAVVRGLTIACGYNTDAQYATRRAVVLTAPDVLIERVKATGFGAGDSLVECVVIGIDVSNANDRLGSIQECVVTEPGNTESAEEPELLPAITCLSLGSRGWRTFFGMGGAVVRNRVHDIKFTGPEIFSTQRSPVRAIAFGGCSGARIADNEVINLDGVGVLSDAALDENTVVENNRFINVNVGVFLLGPSAPYHQSKRLQVRNNIIILGKVDTIWNGLFGIWCDFSHQLDSFLKDCWIERNFVRGTTIGSFVPFGIKIEEMKNLTDSQCQVEGNVLEVPDPDSNDFNVAFENAIVYSAKDFSKLGVHGNRGANGTELRLKLKEALTPYTPYWGPCSTRDVHYDCTVLDGRGGLSADDFIGEGNSFALGWSVVGTNGTSVFAENGQQDHPGIVKILVGSSSGASVLFRCASSGVILGGNSTHVLEFAARRTRAADATQNYECRMGFLEGSAVDRGAWFQILWASNVENKIVLCAKNGANSSSSVSTFVDNDDPPKWRTYRIEIIPNPASGVTLEARFFVDREYVGRIQNAGTEIIPASGNPLQMGFWNRLIAIADPWPGMAILLDYSQYQVARANS